MVQRLLVLLALAATLLAQDAELTELVDLPSHKSRQKRADELARDERWDIDAWLGAMRRFKPRDGARTGTITETARLGAVNAAISLFVPDAYEPDRPAPLLLALHGTGGEGSTEARRWRGVAEDLGMIVCAPTDAGKNVGYTFEARERDEALAALRWVRRRYNIDEDRIHITGISRGGHMTWDLGTRFPDRWASLVPMIGGPRLDPSRGQNNLRYVENIAHLPIRDLQGEGDDRRMIFNVRLAFETLKKHGARDAKLLTFPELGHSFRFDAVEWNTFLGKARRDPVPPRVVRLAARKGEGRAYWVEITQTKRPVKETFVPQVRADAWAKLDDGGKRRFMANAARKRTARLAVEMSGPGVFVAESEGVQRFRLLLTSEMFVARTSLRITWHGRMRGKTAKVAKRVLLREFAERFDRTFLPVAEVKMP